MDIQEARVGLHKAHQYRQHVKKNGALFRIEHLTQLAMEKERYGEKSHVHYLQEMQGIETIWKQHRRIKFIEKKLEKTSTTCVTKKMGDGSVKEFTDKVELEKAIISENIKKYHQTEATCPLFNPMIYKEIGPIGTSPANKAI